jgi:hypothetical protein
VKNNDGVEISEENGVIKQVVSDDIIKEDIFQVHIEVNKNISNDKQSNEVKDLVNASAKLSDGICLPPGYGSVKLGKVLMRLLEEKIKVSTSHSERELLRKTIHVLVCGGCKDREKHNKVKCRRCEDRDKRKEEVKGKVFDKDKQKIVDKNGNIINKNVFVTTTKESPTKSIVNNDIKGVQGCIYFTHPPFNSLPCFNYLPQNNSLTPYVKKMLRAFGCNFERETILSG